MALSLVKRAWNTVWLPVRVWWTIVYWWLDAVNTVATLPKQVFEIVSNTTGQIKDVFGNAWNKWKRYNKLVNVPLSPFVATWTAIEGAIRSVVNPSWNALTHTRDVAWNTLVNAWNSIKWTFSDKPVSDFKYEHLKTSDIGKKNYISKRQWFSSDTKKDDKKEDKKVETAKWPSEKEIALEKKVGELEAKNKSLESTIERLSRQQEETNKKLLEVLSELKKKSSIPEKKEEDWWKIIKLDPKKREKTNPKNWKKTTKTLEGDENEENEDKEMAA